MALNDIGKPFRKSYAKEGDTCKLCERKIPEGKLILKRDNSNSIVCLLCMIDLAKVE